MCSGKKRGNAEGFPVNTVGKWASQANKRHGKYGGRNWGTVLERERVPLGNECIQKHICVYWRVLKSLFMGRAKMYAQKRLEEKTLRFQPLAILKAQVEHQGKAKTNW